MTQGMERMLKHSLLAAGLLVLTSCSSQEQPKPDPSKYSVRLKYPVKIVFLDEKSGIIHVKETRVILGTITRKWDGGYVSGDLDKHWDGNTLVVRSNTDEYRIPYSSISYFTRDRPDVQTEYDAETNKNRIVGKAGQASGEAKNPAP